MWSETCILRTQAGNDPEALTLKMNITGLILNSDIYFLKRKEKRFKNLPAAGQLSDESLVIGIVIRMMRIICHRMRQIASVFLKITCETGEVYLK